jgi:hypothetical protein
LASLKTAARTLTGSLSLTARLAVDLSWFGVNRSEAAFC